MKSSNGEDISDGVEFIAGDKGYFERDTYLELGNVSSGTYFVYVEMEWQQPERNSFIADSLGKVEDLYFNVTSYGRSAVTFEGEQEAFYDQLQILEGVFTAKATRGGDGIDAKDMS